MVNLLNIMPTWSEAFHYAAKNPAFIAEIAGGAIAVAAWVFLAIKKLSQWGGIAIGALFLLLVGGGILIAIHRPLEIEGKTNDFPITEQQQAYYDSIPNGRQVYLDSLYNNCLMIGAAHNCK